MFDSLLHIEEKKSVYLKKFHFFDEKISHFTKFYL